MNNVTNLNQFRKHKAQVEKKVRAKSNSVKFGRAKDDKNRSLAETAKSKANLDNHKRDDT
ncbi:DUF4169 family protein [Pseudopelagicola sp. nBUS_19]|uniref:DUF4169 family protein n=1 Tax=Pseudopelagicola sp. nBUS_19 TaxID=3395316 RepID=UPI003EC06FF9